MKNSERVKQKRVYRAKDLVGGMCPGCAECVDFEVLPESEVNDEEITRYKRFGVG